LSDYVKRGLAFLVLVAFALSVLKAGRDRIIHTNSCGMNIGLKKKNRKKRG